MLTSRNRSDLLCLDRAVLWQRCHQIVQIFQEKRIISAEELRQTVEDLDGRGEKRLGPIFVAKAWTDPTFKAELLRNAADAVQKLGIQASNFAPKPQPAGWHAHPVIFGSEGKADLLTVCLLGVYL